MTETQVQTSTYGEVTQAGIALVRVLGDLGKTWILSRNEQRRASNQQPAPTTPNADAVIRTAGVSQAASAATETAKLSSPVPATSRVTQDATAEERARALAEQARAEARARAMAEQARAEERVRALAERARAVEARIEAQLAEMKVLLEQFLVAQRVPAPSQSEAQAARAEAATVPSPPAAQPPLQVNAGHSVITPSPVAVAISYDDVVAPAKILAEFTKDLEAIKIRSGVVQGQKIDKAGVQALAKMPGLNELRATILSMINQPATKLVRTIKEPGAALARVVKAKSEKAA